MPYPLANGPKLGGKRFGGRYRTRTSRLMLPKHALYQMSYTEKNGGGDWLRTCDSLLAKQVLCQLSYTPETKKCWWIELESNQLVSRRRTDLQSAAVTHAALNPKLEPRERFELPTPCFEGRRSVHAELTRRKLTLVVADGIGPSTTGL